MKSDFNYKSIVKKYSNILNKIDGSKEENIKYHLIGPMLEDLGFKKEWHDLEPSSHKNSRKFMDILVRDDQGNRLVLEAKKDNKKLSHDDISQLLTYMSDQHSEWGILTNGYEWVLVNREIKTIGNPYLFNEKAVAHIYLDTKVKNDHSPKHLNLFTHEAIFSKKSITSYYKDLQQFKVYHYNGNEHSWMQYKNKVMRLIDYSLQRYDYYHQFLNASEIESLLQYIADNKRGDKKLSVQYIKVIFYSLKTFFKVMYEVGNYKFNPLEKLEFEDVLQLVPHIIKEKEDQTEEYNIEEVIKQSLELIDLESNSVRNKLIFLLMIYGLDREEIASLKWGNVVLNNKESYIISNSKKEKKINLHYTPVVKSLIEKHRKVMKKDKVKTQWLVYKKDGKKLSPKTITDEIVNSKLKKFSDLTIEKVQQEIFKTVIRDSKDVFTVLYLRGFSVSRLLDLVDWDDIEKLADFKKMVSKHPFKSYL